MTQYQVAKPCGQAYGQSASTELAMNGFSKFGLWPVSRQVFSNVDFDGSDALLHNIHQYLQMQIISVDEIPLSNIIPKKRLLNTFFEKIKSLPGPSGLRNERREPNDRIY